MVAVMFLSGAYPVATTAGTAAGTAASAAGTEGEEVVSGVRSRRRISEAACCPVCSCTLRPGELQTHLALELDRLAKLSGPPPKRRAGAPNGSNNDDTDATGCTGGDVYERVKRNREKRLRACRGRGETVVCPVCDRRLSAAGAEAHVDACLRRSSRNEEDDESIDVEGDGTNEDENEDRFVSYEWCSQVRVRASALQLLDGGELPHGAMLVRRASTDTHLVVDGDDDDLLYGPPQYSPSRIVPQDHNDAECDRIASDSNSNGVENGEELDLADNAGSFPGQHKRTVKVDLDDEPKMNTCYNIVVEALKSRIRELEQQLGSKNRRSEIKCLICIGPYREPVVSVQCWHVYCEGCWLASLSAKKTCPQCNTITTSQHLRRIYL